MSVARSCRHCLLLSSKKKSCRAEGTFNRATQKRWNGKWRAITQHFSPERDTMQALVQTPTHVRACTQRCQLVHHAARPTCEYCKQTCFIKSSQERRHTETKCRKDEDQTDQPGPVWSSDIHGNNVTKETERQQQPAGLRRYHSNPCRRLRAELTNASCRVTCTDTLGNRNFISLRTRCERGLGGHVQARDT